MRSFFLGGNAICGDSVTITGELYRHMARVLRIKEGSEVELIENGGARHRGTVEEVGAKSLTVRISASAAPAAEEPGLRITLLQGMPKGEKLDLILQKCTELGVAEVVAFDAARSVVKLRGDRSATRLARYEKIVQEAARQSGRRSAPKVALGGTLSEVLADSRHEVKLLLYEGEEKTTLHGCFGAFEAPGSVAVVVGPEGGLAPEEVRQALAAGFTPVTLGKRILRTETAGLAMLSILQFHWGDMV
ncbi:16S rRNA (uracil(1498)-N(3))-methyltransferase [Citrifermentans bremense]|uniref:16S rRNA (uracil(1498)-N(3))-methyltransferase n=1 Tax=Citrifermentans bremense TaxID=60035 RepID=UPI0004097CDC|nr:16S rRNA (uracil(1498)-N(3))-methyltransferase [Citrifermentans bremense]